jgi:hypothetical protein
MEGENFEYIINMIYRGFPKSFYSEVSKNQGSKEGWKKKKTTEETKNSKES